MASVPDYSFLAEPLADVSLDIVWGPAVTVVRQGRDVSGQLVFRVEHTAMHPIVTGVLHETLWVRSFASGGIEVATDTATERLYCVVRAPMMPHEIPSVSVIRSVGLAGLSSPFDDAVEGSRRRSFEFPDAPEVSKVGQTTCKLD